MHSSGTIRAMKSVIKRFLTSGQYLGCEAVNVCTCELGQFSQRCRLLVHFTNIRQSPGNFSKDHARSDYHSERASIPRYTGRTALQIPPQFLSLLTCCESLPNISLSQSILIHRQRAQSSIIKKNLGEAFKAAHY